MERGESTTFAYSRSVPPCVWLDVFALVGFAVVIGLIVAATYLGPC